MCVPTIVTDCARVCQLEQVCLCLCTECVCVLCQCYAYANYCYRLCARVTSQSLCVCVLESFIPLGGQNSSLVVFGLAVHSVAGSILLWGNFYGRGDFSLGVNMGSNSIPPKTLSDESIDRGLVCAYMHYIARTQKILTFTS